LKRAFGGLLQRITKIAATLEVKVKADEELAQEEGPEEDQWEEPEEVGALGASVFLS
jgi:hypothetical protein